MIFELCEQLLHVCNSVCMSASLSACVCPSLSACMHTQKFDDILSYFHIICDRCLFEEIFPFDIGCNFTSTLPHNHIPFIMQRSLAPPRVYASTYAPDSMIIFDTEFYFLVELPFFVGQQYRWNTRYKFFIRDRQQT